MKSFDIKLKAKTSVIDITVIDLMEGRDVGVNECKMYIKNTAAALTNMHATLHSEIDNLTLATLDGPSDGRTLSEIDFDFSN